MHWMIAADRSAELPTPPTHVVFPATPAASVLVALGMALGLWLWSRATRRDPDMIWIALGGLVGALIGAKVGFWLCEAPLGWGRPDWWIRMLTGKTILGALLGGWIGVEWSKRWMDYRRPTGDQFARVIPVGILLGRFGCLMHGCCQGRPLKELGWSLGPLQQWPAVGVEMLFQLFALAAFWLLRNQPRLAGQHFHLYLIAYGTFRLIHETLRATPRYPGTPITPYMLLAGVCVVAGVTGFVRRARAQGSPKVS